MIEITKKIKIHCDEGKHDFIELNKEYGWPQETYILYWCKNCGVVSLRESWGDGSYVSIGEDKIPLLNEFSLKQNNNDKEN